MCDGFFYKTQSREIVFDFVDFPLRSVHLLAHQEGFYFPDVQPVAFYRGRAVRHPHQCLAAQTQFLLGKDFGAFNHRL
ncbi:hypothetical protein A3C91_00355 [Candidatus Azambacteria bacterium RIFCSPHIGHO2_02_FULL_52_12]|nr:MAG: hypothetical protein A3C91_00355 [Candidatus Azambacteria bacterium RIFCSPHIGHO2_02_FULL_52_12]